MQFFVMYDDFSSRSWAKLMIREKKTLGDYFDIVLLVHIFPLIQPIATG